MQTDAVIDHLSYAHGRDDQLPYVSHRAIRPNDWTPCDAAAPDRHLSRLSPISSRPRIVVGATRRDHRCSERQPGPECEESFACWERRRISALGGVDVARALAGRQHRGTRHAGSSARARRDRHSATRRAHPDGRPSRPRHPPAAAPARQRTATAAIATTTDAIEPAVSDTAVRVVSAPTCPRVGAV